MSFVFYDTETTGLNRTFDQILQFAAIKTDWELHEVDRFEIRCRLQPHVVPHPGALLTTGTAVERLLDPSLPSHYEMVCAVAAKFEEWSPATFIGYNSLGYDEHLLRQALYQCLHYPYLTTTGHNSRADALGIAHAAAALAPGSLRVPLSVEGKPTFSLAALAAANGFEHRSAHDALADAEAVLHLCRHLSREAPHLWSNALRFSKKATAAEFISDEVAFLLTQTYGTTAYHFAVTRIGGTPADPNAAFVLDLSADLDELRSLPQPQLVARLGQTPKVVRTIRTNASPTMTELDESPLVLGRAPAEWRALAAEIAADPEFRSRLVEARIAGSEPWPVPEHVEEQIHEVRPSGGDKTLMRQFHAADWPARWDLARRLEEPRLKQLAARQVFFNSPEAMPETDRQRFEAAVARRLLGRGFVSPPWLTLDGASAEIDEVPRDQIAGLDNLRDYLAARRSSAETLLG